MNGVVHQSIDELLARVRGEYFEMPGLQLTEAQARRLWGLDKTTCRQLLTRLLDARFLARTRDGRYRRADGSVAGNNQLGAPRETAGLLRDVPSAHRWAVSALASGPRR